MAIERVTTQGWGSRLKSAFGGILIGLLFVVGASVLQFWNEGRTLHQYQLLEQGRSEVIPLPADAASNPALDALVHSTAELHAEGQRVDPVFNQVAEGLALRRKVEMYQWKERSEKKEETNVGGSKTTRTIYHYDRVWDDEPIDHTRFEEPSGHENPGAFPFESETWRAESVRLGELPLGADVIREVGGWKPMAPEPGRLPANLAASFSAQGSALSTESGETRIGDLRVSFERVPEGPLSLVARLRGGQLQTDEREQGELLLLERGSHSAAALFDAAQSRNTGIGWAIRIGGFVLMWIGFAMVFAPLAVFADVLPFAGRLTRGVTGLISGVLAATISFIAIASGWLFHRPWLLLLVGAAVVAGVVYLLRRRKPAATLTAPAQSAAPPPPPPH